MMRHVSRLVTPMVVAVGLVLTAGATANAEGTNVKDKASDVNYVPDISKEDVTILGYQASIDSGVDLRGMRVRHGKKTVTLRLKFAQLAPDAKISMEFRSNGRRQSDHYLFSVSTRRAVLLESKAFDTCSVPLTVKTGRKGTLYAVIKRSCLGDPERIKVSGGVFRGDLDSMSGPGYADPISNTKVQGPSWTKWLKSG